MWTRQSRLALVALAALLAVAHSVRIDRFYNGALNHRLARRAGRLHAAASADPPMPTFPTLLDNFDATSNVTFNLRYLVNASQFNGNGPVMFMLGGEGPISPAYLSGHFINNYYAEKFGGLLVALEHRFYGDSLPNGPGSDTPTAQLQYLSSQQALADAAAFQQFIVNQYNLTSANKWIVFGGSYSGCLSAWAKLKYPSLYAGALSASAPLRAELDFFQYMEVVQDSVGPQCASSIHRAVVAAEQLANSDEGKQKLRGLFNLCAPLETDNDLSNFFSTLSDPIAEAVQYSDDNNAAGAYDIKLVCGNFSSGIDPLEALAGLVVAKDSNGTCVDVSYANYIASMKATSAGRSWMWQTCTEFGFYQTAESSKQPFSPRISLQFNVQQCADIYGLPGMTPDVDYTNLYYGSVGLQTTNTFFTNGRVDPWHALGLKADAQPGPGTSVRVMEGTAHCADLYAPRAADLPDLTETRAMQQSAIEMWLAAGPAK
jgi:pimeloyl-ACP methyl ester carboxylesterase